MSGKSYMAENRELAYSTWCECGQNIELTIRTLKDKHGLPVSKPTIYDWIEKFNWKERSARAESEKQRIRDAACISTEDRFIADLERHKRMYERFFDSLGEGSIDNQAMYAYNNLVKTIVDIKAKTAAYKADLFVTFLRDQIEWLAKNDPEAVAAIENNFDDFVAYAREKYGR